MAEERIKNSITKEKRRILNRMAEIDMKSEEYAILSERLQQITSAEQSDKGWKGQLGGVLLQSALSSVSSVVTVLGVLKHEDRGNIITTKALGYVEKPKYGQLHYDRTPEPRKKG